MSNEFPKNKIEFPTVGRIVHFFEPGRPEPWPAMVVAVPDRPLFPHLAVYTLDGVSLHRDTPHHSCSASNSAVEYWDWMPFQKSQAGKTEELQRQLQERATQPNDLGKLQAGAPSPVDGKR